MRNFSPGAEEVLKVAREGAAELNHPQLRTEHLLWAFSYASGMKEVLGLDPQRIRKELGKWFVPQPHFSGTIQLSPRVKRVLELAKKEATSRKHPWVMPEHILYALWTDADGPVDLAFNRYKVSFPMITAILNGLDFFEECGGPDAPESLAKAIMGKAKDLARTFNNAEIEPEHLILAMIYGPSEYRQGCPLSDFYLVDQLTQELETRLDLLSTGKKSTPAPSANLKKLFLRAMNLSAQYATPERIFPCEPIHFLVAVMEWEPKLLPLDQSKIRESMDRRPQSPVTLLVRKWRDGGLLIELGKFLHALFTKRYTVKRISI